MARIAFDVLAGAAILVGLFTGDTGLVFLGLVVAGGAAWLHVSAAPVAPAGRPDRRDEGAP